MPPRGGAPPAPPPRPGAQAFVPVGESGYQLRGGLDLLQPLLLVLDVVPVQRHQTRLQLRAQLLSVQGMSLPDPQRQPDQRGRRGVRLGQVPLDRFVVVRRSARRERGRIQEADREQHRLREPHRVHQQAARLVELRGHLRRRQDRDRELRALQQQLRSRRAGDLREDVRAGQQDAVVGQLEAVQRGEPAVVAAFAQRRQRRPEHRQLAVHRTPLLQRRRRLRDRRAVGLGQDQGEVDVAGGRRVAAVRKAPQQVRADQALSQGFPIGLGGFGGDGAGRGGRVGRGHAATVSRRAHSAMRSETTPITCHARSSTVTTSSTRQSLRRRSSS